MARTKTAARPKASAPLVTLRYCAVRLPKAPQLPKGIDPKRRRLILQTSDKWLNGSTIRYWFFDKPAKWSGPQDQRDVVRRAFANWKQLGVGLEFLEVDERAKADLRIAFEQGDGSWSYVGRDVLTKRKDPRTMNFGWSLTEDPQEGLDTAMHEIGHTLGFPHEHQNPFAGIVWNEAAVYQALAAKPNFWSKQETFDNILSKLTPDEVQGSAWDPDSVMHYPFEAGLIKEPAQYRSGLTPAGGLSARDRTWARKFYPPQDPAAFPCLTPLNSAPLSLGPGEQADFTFVPTVTRTYEFRTFGTSDTTLALFEGAAPARLVASDDDSGENRNAYFKVPLQANARYVLRARLQYASSQGETAVMVW